MQSFYVTSSGLKRLARASYCDVGKLCYKIFKHILLNNQMDWATVKAYANPLQKVMLYDIN